MFTERGAPLAFNVIELAVFSISAPASLSFFKTASKLFGDLPSQTGNMTLRC